MTPLEKKYFITDGIEILPPKAVKKEELIELVNDAIDEHKTRYPNGFTDIILDSMMRIEKINNALKAKFTEVDFAKIKKSNNNWKELQSSFLKSKLKGL